MSVQKSVADMLQWITFLSARAVRRASISLTFHSQIRDRKSKWWPTYKKLRMHVTSVFRSTIFVTSFDFLCRSWFL